MRNKKLWIFNAGMSFDGNPKWLFMYIQKHRPDIEAWWFCYNKSSEKYIKRLGYKACQFDSEKAKDIGSRAGVYVVNQRKEAFQSYLKGITILNLWHGVGCKYIEKRINYGILNERIAKKYIQNMHYYRNNELFLVTSPMMEKHFTEHCSLEEHNIIRGAYPNCFSPDKVSTYDHDFLKGRGIPSNTRVAVYAPTYRMLSTTNFFSGAIPDMDRLVKTLEENNMVMIFKMHPKMENDFQYLNLKKIYKDCPRLVFWDNADDMYEVFDKIDLAIVDYSSIFYDMLARGVKHFARYIFDYDNKENVTDFAFDYLEMTCGPICNSFDELLAVLSNYESIDIADELDRIGDLFWQYAQAMPSMDNIIDKAIGFEPLERELPTLYSFDIFDTLVTRSVSAPLGIFLYVQDKIKACGDSFPKYFADNYFKIRPWAESNAREYYNKSKLYRQTDNFEITFDMIFERMKDVYGLTDEQVKRLGDWELEAEYSSSTPICENIERLKELVAANETVVLISDMYLSEAFIRKMLVKSDPVFENIPIYVSTEYGYRKTTKQLFLEVYHSLDYNYGQWIHHGDNPKADGTFPRALGIKTVKIPEPKLLNYERIMNDFIRTYDGYQVAKLFDKFRKSNKVQINNFAYRYVSLYFVPYVNWVIRHAIEHKIDCLYFVSRDGYHLKCVADAIIEERGYNIKTKYIYGSRKAWRIPALIDSIDPEFFSEYGNFSNVSSFNGLLRAAAMTEEQFASAFPELMYLKEQGGINPDTAKMLRDTFSTSEKMHSHLLKVAAERRPIIEEYLKQEINFNEKYAFVEFWARGYTQTSLAKIIWHLLGRETENIFYYARSIYPTHGNLVRYNFTTNNFSYIFIEAIFANLHYKSIERFERDDEGRVVPVIVPNDNFMKLQDAMEEYLPKFAKDYVRLSLFSEDASDRTLFDFALSYFNRHSADPIWATCFAPLKYSETIYGEDIQWAPPMTWRDIFASMRGIKFQTKNMTMSLKRSSKVIRAIYNFYVKHLKGKSFTAKIRRLLGK